MSSYPDWIVMHDGTKGEMAYALECLRCGTIQKPPSGQPLPVDYWCKVAKGFERYHLRCKKKTRGGHR